MRLTSLLTGACCAALPVLAQPDFTASSVFQVGDSYALMIQDFAVHVPQTGSAHVWDFSGNTTAGPWGTWTKPTSPYKFQAASKSLQTSFATSEVNEYNAGAFPRDLFYTYSASKDTLYYDGLHTSSNYRYVPHIPYLAFPLKFNDSGTVHVDQFTNPSQPTVKTGSVDRTWIYDGYGTVKFPYGEAQDVFRIRTVQKDSAFIGTFVTGVQYDELIWFRKSDGIPVLRFYKNGTTINAYFTSAEAGSGIARGAVPGRGNMRLENGGRFLALPTGKPARRVRITDPAGRVLYSVPASGTRIGLPYLAGGVRVIHVEYRDGGSERGAFLSH
jgi:hypothetical protein